ncbi:MAG TPA: VOC family protein [Vicinamibacterales bacterium]|nr:VOC family protein [Vicinamibacterales bacterium]
MRRCLRLAGVAALLMVWFTSASQGQAKPTLPYDHIHLNEPAAEGSAWWEKNIPDGRRITEAPNRIMYGAVRLMFLSPRSNGGSDGSVIEHLGFSVADLDATMRALTSENAKVIEPVKNTPGLYKSALIEDPWGTRIQLVQDPDLVGLHHVQLRAPDPDAMYTWLLDKFGGERTKLKGQIDSVKYAGVAGFTTVYIVAAKGSSVPSQGRVIDHIGWRSTGPIDETKAMLEGKKVQLTSQPRPLNLPDGPSINFFYVAGPDGTRIELVERPGLKPGQ